MRRLKAARSYVLVALSVLALAACNSTPEGVFEFDAVDLGSPVAPETYAGDVRFRIAQSLDSRAGEVPFALYLGLSPAGETRLGLNALADLRGIQDALPERLSGPIDPSCNLGLTVDFSGSEADGDTLRAGASVRASLYRCKAKGTPDEQRGWRMISQTVDAAATLRGDLDGNCIRLSLTDLSLKPRGILGGLASLFGLTEKVRVAILEEAAVVLDAYPICPEPPAPISFFQPRFEALGIEEIGAGGVGAGLKGSADISADTLVDTLAWAGERAAGGSDGLRFTDRTDGRVGLALQDAMAVGDTEIGYGIALQLSPVSTTRIGIEALLDLRDIQARLPDLLADRVVTDNCGGRIQIEGFDTEADGTTIVARASLEMESYDCVRSAPGTWERGALEETKQVDVRAHLSAELVDQCVVFRLLDLDRDPPGALGQIQTGSGRLAAARALVFEAIELVLEEAAICPELGPELSILEPHFDYGAPQEIGEGGAGIAMRGSIDLGPETVVELLALLQSEGLLPPAP